MEKGHCFLSLRISGSSAFLPMSRLASKMVFSGLDWNAFFAASPTLVQHKGSISWEKEGTYSRSSPAKDTHEGVIRLPWSFAMISTLPPFITATQEYLPQPQISPHNVCRMESTELTLCRGLRVGKVSHPPSTQGALRNLPIPITVP